MGQSDYERDSDRKRRREKKKRRRDDRDYSRSRSRSRSREKESRKRKEKRQKRKGQVPKDDGGYGADHPFNKDVKKGSLSHFMKDRMRDSSSSDDL